MIFTSAWRASKIVVICGYFLQEVEIQVSWGTIAIYDLMEEWDNI